MKRTLSPVTHAHIDSIKANKHMNPNPFELTEIEFGEAKEISTKFVSGLHKEAGHDIDLALSAVLFVYESLIEEREELNG